ncbi:hypothetical protein ABZ471_44485 [Streptomyces sp. NPDC005728]|uniref:hypothetical protein n=1 Tax=Streptomyces sp. NPDC005728 TaxID=3157054 RepID=UPI0033DF2EE9
MTNTDRHDTPEPSCSRARSKKERYFLAAIVTGIVTGMVDVLASPVLQAVITWFTPN